MITGSIKLLNITGSSGDAFGKANKNPYTTNYDSTFISPIGEIPRNMTSEEPRLTGEFSGSTIAVTKSGELNRTNLFKSQQQPTILFNVRAFNQANIIPLACDITLEVTSLGEYLIFTPIGIDNGAGSIGITYEDISDKGETNKERELTYPFEGGDPKPQSIQAAAIIQWGEFIGWFPDANDTHDPKSEDALLILTPEMVYKEKHAWYARFKKSPPNSGGKILTLQVCNANGEKNDNFVIIINGVEIGLLDLSHGEPEGGLFIASNNNELTTDDVSSGFVCPMELITVTHFDPIHLTKGRNRIEMINAQDNGNGNLGVFEIAYYDINPDGSNILINKEPVASLTFDPLNGGDEVLYFDLD